MSRAATHRTRHRRGAALLVVMVVIGVCSVLSLAMMSSSTLQAMVGDNLARKSRADALAESGINYAIYQLKQSGLWEEYFQGTTLSLGSDVPGTCTISVQRVERSASQKAAEYSGASASDLATAQEYRIVSQVELTDAQGRVTARSGVTARVLAWAELRIGQAAVLNGNLSLAQALPTTVIFESIAVNGSLMLRNSNNVTPGMAYAKMFNVQNIPVNRQSSFANAGAWITTPGNVRTFATYLYGDGKVYSATPVPHVGGRLSSFNSQTPGASNPANIYRHVGNLTLGGNVRLRGTLVVENGDLILEGVMGAIEANNIIDATASHSQGFPAIVVKNGSIRVAPGAAGKVLIARGVTWVSGEIGTSAAEGVNTETIFEGAVVMPSNAANIRTRGKITFTHTSHTNVPMLDQSLPVRVEVLEWRKGT